MKRITTLFASMLLAVVMTGTALAAEPTENPPPVQTAALYPTDVVETVEGGNRRLEKVYLLTAADNPANIPTEDFEREGYRYTLLDVTRQDYTESETKEHAETITLDSDTKDMNQIMPQLAVTREVTTEDGFTGILTLDTASVQVETAGYAFSAYQNSALDELLSDRSALSSLAGDLSITGSDVRDVLAALPTDLEQARQDTVQTALQLVGKVTYFWGGKSRVIGWDSRWGQLRKVTAAGNSTSGTYRPFGLDCSGFVDWTFNNSLGYIIGHGGGARAQHTYCTNISQSEAQPGDLAFYPDDSHVGVIVGRNAAGKLLVCHCSSGRNNVTVTEFSASGFTAVGRPDIFSS